MMLDEWSLASSGLVSERQVRDAAAWDQVGVVMYSNLLSRLDLHHSIILHDNLDAAKANPSNRFSDLQECFL